MRRKAFTLIELIVTIVVVSVMSTAIGLAMFNIIGEIKKQTLLDSTCESIVSFLSKARYDSFRNDESVEITVLGRKINNESKKLYIEYDENINLSSYDSKFYFVKGFYTLENSGRHSIESLATITVVAYGDQNRKKEIIIKNGYPYHEK